ncbi:hypothetical protein [Bradyrhizobium septentrionale]|uniref:Uncharacterized protein n=1 Tax=Bradyrhizobium septentrionale TaxID=1404411 RepID=A0ABZ2P8C7_9BRAD
MTQGVIIKDGAGTHLFIASTAGTAGNGAEPSWNTAAVGNTTTDNGVTWTYIGLASSFAGAAAPHARLGNALANTWSMAGDFIYVGDNHSETSSSSFTLAGQNTASSPNYVLCHNHSGNYPPQSSDLTTGATIACSGSFSQIVWTSPNVYVRGIGFVCSNSGTSITFGSAGGGGQFQKFVLCPVTFSGSAGSGCHITIGNGANLAGRVIHDNCVFTFNNAGQDIRVNANQWEWRNTAGAVSGTTPSTLIAGSVAVNVWLHGLDLSLLGSGKQLVNLGSGGSGLVLIEKCKIDTAVTVASIGNDATTVVLSKCDSGAINYRDEVYRYGGTMTTETTIVRTGGQSDGTTPAARKIVTTANTFWPEPFEAPPIAAWNETVGSPVTVTLYGIWGGGAVPNNDDFWIDVEYLGSSSTPISSRATATKASILATNAALSTDGSAWGGSTTAFKASVTITPQMKGFIMVTPKMAKPSTTLYYDEKLGIS